MSPEEKAISKQMEKMLGYVPLGTLDLLKVLTHPDMLPLTESYVEVQKKAT